MFTTYKRWTLKDGRDEVELVEIVSARIIPHYRRLDPEVRLRLLRVEGTRSYLALQDWPSRRRWESAMASEAFKAWFREYEPTLRDWDELVELEAEWETEELAT